ncbi:hypothetical protein Fcan01_11132 [Folsomia candida]|uniref:Uncharacterized protein n=1 Tax=Folsomia candida TaxID=158441 RepID=A0A226EB20_FOLCA|nr:hypothetical protein Fcan01_11132 [Folsomia candida]
MFVVQYVVVLARMLSLVFNVPKNSFLVHIISCCLSVTNIAHWTLGVVCRRKTDEIAAYFNGILIINPDPLKAPRQAKLHLKDVISTGKFPFSDVSQGEPVRFTLCFLIYAHFIATIMMGLLAVMVLCTMPHFLRSTFPDCAANGDEFVWDFGVHVSFKWVVSLLDIWEAGFGIYLSCAAICLPF